MILLYYNTLPYTPFRLRRPITRLSDDRTRVCVGVCWYIYFRWSRWTGAREHDNIIMYGGRHIIYLSPPPPPPATVSRKSYVVFSCNNNDRYLIMITKIYMYNFSDVQTMTCIPIILYVTTYTHPVPTRQRRSVYCLRIYIINMRRNNDIVRRLKSE